MSTESQTLNWPERCPVFGIGVSVTDYNEASNLVISAAKNRISSCVDAMNVHVLVTAVKDKEFNTAIVGFDMVCPDGQPVRWALNKFNRKKITERVYGPTLTLHVLKKAEKEGLSVYFYGSKESVLNALKKKLMEKFPDLRIAGMESPPFRKLTFEEENETADRINNSGASILFIGLGCPKQELYASRNKGKIMMPMLCVGAAFDFHAGMLMQAPSWMQKHGLEWLFRFCMEPGRLWKRYLVTNTTFLLLCVKQLRKK
ncbi:MAG: WecB/TagA/CpsF family glycosyltransferase [Fibrobacter sp.]|nr:WecB/TagA/CpsF family glycosyltransferase [Fibrobacter sp.]